MTAHAQRTPPERGAPPSRAAPPVDRSAAGQRDVYAGNAAPQLSVERFLKGEPVTAFQEGKIYVLECWATWCGPCIAAMPHLSQIQRELKDKGVVVIGVNILEKDRPDGTSEDKLAVVEQFLAQRGDSIGYAIAYDGEAKAFENRWFRRAGLSGIPASFVVDRQGMIAWVGHPQDLDLVLADLIDGTWDPKAGPARVAAAKREFTAALGQYERSVEEGDAAWEQVISKYPALARPKQVDRLKALVAAGHFDRAFAVANAIVDDATATRNDGALNDTFNVLVPRGPKPARLDEALVLRIAQTYSELTVGGDPIPAKIMLFRAYIAVGDSEKAERTKQDALELTPPDRRQRIETTFRALEGRGRQAPAPGR